MDSDASEYWDGELKEAMHMGKWNFDVLFDGSIDQQRENVANFFKGVQHRTREFSARYADAVLSGDNSASAAAQIADRTEAVKQLTEDPRLRSLQVALQNQEEQKMADTVVNSLREAIRRSR